MSLAAYGRTKQLVCIVLIALTVFAAACGDRTSTAAGSGPGGQISPNEVSALVDRYISAFNTRDRSTYISLFADGATVEDPLGSLPIKSASLLGAFFDATTSVPLHLELEQDSIRVSGNHVTFRFQLELGAGTSQVATKPVDALDIDSSSKILSLVAYWKPAELRPVQ
jgi:steroid Delta-isomerase